MKVVFPGDVQLLVQELRVVAALIQRKFDVQVKVRAIVVAPDIALFRIRSGTRLGCMGRPREVAAARLQRYQAAESAERASSRDHLVRCCGGQS